MAETINPKVAFSGGAGAGGGNGNTTVESVKDYYLSIKNGEIVLIEKKTGTRVAGEISSLLEKINLLIDK